MIKRFATTAGAIAALALAVLCAPAAAQTASKLSAAKGPPAGRDVAEALPVLPPLNEPITTYVLKKGDTLWGLGDKYFLRRPTYEEVRIRNGVRYVRRMSIGLQLVIPTRLLRTEPVDAVVGAFKGAVSITGGGAAGATRVGMIVREGAVISTGANAFARIDLPDGSRVSVPSQSRVRLEVLHRVVLSTAVERTFAVEDGRSESAVAPITRPQDNYFVKTPVSVSAVRGTDFRVGYEEAAKAATTSVVEGTVGVDAPGGGGSVTVPARFGVGVRPGAPLTVVPLLPAPTVQAAGRVQDAAAATFDVDPVEGAKAYRAQLASDAGMLEIFAEQTRADGHFDFQGLDGGDYFLRVTALDPSDIEGLPRVYAFERDLNTIAATGASAEGGGRFLFKWRAEGRGPRTYRFQVSLEPSGDAPLIDEGGLTDTQITLTNLPPGVYRWRVMSATVRKGGLVEKWTPPQKFTVPSH